MTKSTSNRQLEVQGLRGISILFVVFYHAHQLFAGGFIGVDVFFVISGYVITKSLLQEFEITGNVSGRNFVSRRIKRLLPASALATVFILVGSVFLFSPFGQQSQIALTSISSTFFSANLYFIFQNSYAALSNNPFRHMWSLGVEEQFYIFFIILVLLILRFVRSLNAFLRLLLIMSIITGVVSFILGFALSNGVRIAPLPTRLGFFSPFARMWEIQLGVVVAILMRSKSVQKINSRIADVLGLCGLILVFYAALSFSVFTNYPGYHALIPSFGTALIIISFSTGTITRILFQSRPLVFLGDISYGTYLWHWPLIVFCEVLFPGNSLYIATSAILSMVPAFLSYKYVELPMMNSSTRRFSPSRIFSTAFSIQIVFALLLLIGARTGFGLEQNLPTRVNDSWADKSNCEMNGDNFPIDRCFIQNSESVQTVLLIGDSQAGSYSDGVKKAASELGLNFAVWYNNGCPVFPRPSIEREDCPKYLADLADLIDELNPIITIVANKSTLYTTGGPQNGGVTIPNADGRLVSSYQEAIGMWSTGIREQFRGSSFRNRNVLLAQQVPPALFEGRSLLKPNSSDSPFNLKLSSDRNELVSQEKASLRMYKTIHLFDPAEFLCPASRCITSTSSGQIYTDKYHLSPIGSLYLSDQIKSAIELAIR